MFKEATKEDAKVFYTLYDELRDHVEKGCDKPTLEQYQALFSKLLEDPNYKFWKIQNENGDDIGVMSINVRFNLFHCKKIIYVDEIVITEKYRNKGYGKKGLAFVADYYKKEGSSVKLELSTDYQNSPARKFYDKIGFDDYAALYKIKLE